MSRATSVPPASRDPACAVPTLRPRRVHTSAVVRVTDTLCAADAHAAWGEAEAVGAPQVILVRHGVFAIRGPRGAATADATGALLMNAGEPYEVRHPLDGGDHCTALAFDDATVEQVLTTDGDAASAPAHGAAAAGLFARLHRSVSIEALVQHRLLLRALAARRDDAAAAMPAHEASRAALGPRAGATSPDTLEVDELALTLLGALVRGDVRPGTSMLPRRPRTEHRWIDAVEHLRVYLAADPACNDPLPALARRVHTSEYHLARVFRWRTGLSIHEYRTRLRIAAALDRLTRDADVTTVALALGFASHSHFTSRFTALTGMSPSSYRGRRS